MRVSLPGVFIYLYYIYYLYIFQNIYGEQAAVGQQRGNLCLGRRPWGRAEVRAGSFHIAFNFTFGKALAQRTDVSRLYQHSPGFPSTAYYNNVLLLLVLLFGPFEMPLAELAKPSGRHLPQAHRCRVLGAPREEPETWAEPDAAVNTIKATLLPPKTR